jgi:hypothetical protein
VKVHLRRQKLFFAKALKSLVGRPISSMSQPSRAAKIMAFANFSSYSFSLKD